MTERRLSVGEMQEGENINACLCFTVRGTLIVVPKATVQGSFTEMTGRRPIRMQVPNPPHPGQFIRTEVIQPLGLSVSAAAKALMVSRPTLSSLLNGRADLSGEMALRLEKAFGADMEILMRMQTSCDIARTRRLESRIRVPRFVPDVQAAGRAGDRL